MFRPGEWAAVVTSLARVAGVKEPNGMPRCRACGGEIRSGHPVHRLIPVAGGTHVYVHAECWP